MDERAELVARIDRAAAAGRISAADREIRVRNVKAAGSPAELEMIRRDLDVLDSAINPVAVPAPPGGPAPARGPVPGPAPAPPPAPAPSRGSSRWVPVLIVVVVLAVVAAGVVGLLATSTTSHEASGSGPVPADVLPATGSPTQGNPGHPGAGDPSPVVPGKPSGPAFVLSGPGITAFLATYRKHFGTSKVVELTMYDDYVVVGVPVAGKDRHAGWLYRGGGWTSFGGVTANFPGSATVDTRRLDVPALVRNIAKARRTLHVEAYDQTYVNVDYRPDFDDAPNVNVYVANKFHETGYLATRLDGSVERSYPYGS